MVSVGSLLPRVHAVLIGIDSYKYGWTKLRFAEADVNALAHTLQQDCGWLSAAIRPLIGSRAKARAIKETLKDAFESATSDELVFVYFSGHADLTPKQELFLSAWDTKPDSLASTGMPASSIWDWMDMSAAGYVLLVLDCCYAGAIGGPIHRIRQAWDPTARPRIPRGLGRAVIASCWHDELSSERQTESVARQSAAGHQYASSGHGVFTYHLMEGLRGGGEGLLAVNKFGEVDAASLTDYIRRQLNGEQTPEFLSRGTFPVLVKRKEWMGDASMEQKTTTGRSHPAQRPVARNVWRRQGMPALITAWDLVPSGDQVLLGFDDGSVTVLSSIDGTEIRIIVPPRPESRPTRLVVSPNSTTFALVTDDRRTKACAITLRSLNADDADVVKLDPWSIPVSRVAFSPLSQLVAAAPTSTALGALGCIHVWGMDGSTFARLVRDEFANLPVKDFAFCYPDGKRLVAALDRHPEVYLWDVNAENREAGAGKALKQLTRSDWAPGDESIHTTSAPNDKALACAVIGNQGRVCLWSLPDGSAVPETIPLARVPTALGFSPKSDCIACSAGQWVHLVQVSQLPRIGPVATTSFSSRISSIAFSPDPDSSLIAAAAADGEVKLWDYATGAEVPLEMSEGPGSRKLVKRTAVSGETQVKFSKEGTKMLIVSKVGGLVEVWQLDWV